MGAAYLLRDAADVTLYEKNAYIGGHSRTLEVTIDGRTIPVDTGFIVYNERNYPYLTQLFSELEVPVVKTDMSFGVSIRDGWLEYSSRGLSGLTGNGRNLLRVEYLKMVNDILKFNREAHRYLEAPVSFSLGDCLEELGVGDWFKRYYLLPMGGSIWSCPVDQMLEFPACSLLRFFKNHGLLTVKDHPQWFSVLGGSREYVKRLLGRLGEELIVRPAALRVSRDSDSGLVLVEDEDGLLLSYDEVVIATHPDEALGMIENPTALEQEILSAFRYQPNEVILHTDVDFMPKRKSAWASWVYRSEEKIDDSPSVSLSY